MKPVAEWDRYLEPKQVKGLSPAARGRRALVSLERKIELMRVYARTGVPEGAYVPRNRTQLRKWPDAAAGLWAWTDPKFDSPEGPNAALVETFLALAAQLRPGRKAKVSLRQAHSDLKAAYERIVDQNARLAREVVQLRETIVHSRNSFRPQRRSSP